MKNTFHVAGITAEALSPQEWRALLRAKGWKQKDLARRWNVSETWISKLANNPDRGTHWNDACRGLPDIRARQLHEPHATGTGAPEPGAQE
ncbi:helix-turn-helix transcriptional regulator [Salmonella enterica]|nr:helix-turn-helix transcriptional regulator [Salmonella enterica]